MRVREVRESRGLSQAALAERAGITQQTIAGYETGKRKPTAEILARIAHALGVSSPYLLGLTDSPQRDDRLPPDWVQAVEEAMADGFNPDDLRRLIRGYKLMVGKKSILRP